LQRVTAIGRMDLNRGSLCVARHCEADAIVLSSSCIQSLCGIVRNVTHKLLTASLRDWRTRVVRLLCCRRRQLWPLRHWLLLTKILSASQPSKQSRLHIICDNLYCARKACLCSLKRHLVTLLSIFWWTTRQNAVRSKLSPQTLRALAFHVVHVSLRRSQHLHALFRCLLTHAEHTTATDSLSLPAF